MTPPRPASLAVAHYASLSNFGGVERLMAGLLRHDEDQRHVRHGLLVHDYPVHPKIAAALQASSSQLAYAKYSGRLKLPAAFSWLRNLHLSRQLTDMAPHILIAWNKFGQLPHAFLSSGLPLIYYDHSAAWQSGREQEKHAFLQKIDGVLCCSRASQRMLQLRWEVRLPTACLPNVSPIQAQSRTTHARKLMHNRRFRLGMAGRAAAVKGVPIVLHALKRLLALGYDCELRVAGIGPDLLRYRRIAAQLGISHAVTFLGYIEDMYGFYQDIDCLCAPSISEPFGLACAEAAAAGCVVVISRVDGMTEAVNVNDGAIGLCPTLPLQDYRVLGGSIESLPKLVYDPEADRLCAPKIIEPDLLAQAIAQLLDEPARYHVLSTGALAHAAAQPSFEAYCSALLTELETFRDTRRFMPTDSSCAP
jgi:glycosyltransferase involved in cell wall biosynthesis